VGNYLGIQQWISPNALSVALPGRSSSSYQFLVAEDPLPLQKKTFIPRWNRHTCRLAALLSRPQWCNDGEI
jgi:hypothetical protein